MSHNWIVGLRRALSLFRENLNIRTSSLVREILLLGIAAVVLRVWLPQVLPGLSLLWIAGAAGVLVWRSLVLYEEHICDSYSDPNRLQDFVEAYLYSPSWWRQWYAVQQLSMIAGRRFGHLSLLPARFRHTVSCWRDWWTRERDRLTWDNVARRYVEKVA
jgi:hypothetical protein